MRQFIVRARAAPVNPARFIESIGGEARVEYMAHMITSALMVAKSHRLDTSLTLVMESSADYPRSLTFSGEQLGDLGGGDEAALLQACAGALKAGSRLAKNESLRSDTGITVTASGFEVRVKQALAAGPVYMLDRKGEDIRAASLPEAATFLLSDHIPMPKKTLKGLARQGVSGLRLGPLMLHASQCITIIHNELDYRYL